MKLTRREILTSLGIMGVPLLTGLAQAQGPGRRGRGPQGGAGRGRPAGTGAGHGPDEQFEQDHQAIQTLLQNRNQILRKITNLPDGVKTVTETDNEALRPVLVSHVKAMYARLENVQPIHQRDPLFRALFSHAKEIELKFQATEKGIEVVETSKNPKAVKLIQAHAEVVSLFLKNGHQEVRKNHPVPE